MKAGYLQFKPEFCKPAKNIEAIQRLTENTDFDLIVMPELANSGYFFSDASEVAASSEEIPGGDFCKTLFTIAKEHNAYIAAGLNERFEDKFYNSSVLVYPTGEFRIYRKTHLFNEEKKWFTPGNTPPDVFDILVDGKIVKIGMMICFDWIFPETARTLAIKGAQIICHPSNLVLQYCQKAMFTRAVENRVFTITANRTGTESSRGKELKFTGSSVIVDPKGNYLHTGSETGDECIIVEINPGEALDKYVTPLNHIFEDRRPEFYKK